MLLVIDIGNTNIVLGCIQKEKVYFIERLSTDRKKTDLEYAVNIKNVLEIYQIPIEEIEGGIISSVVPQITEVVHGAAEKLIDKPIKVVGPGVKTGLNILMDNPAQLGSDLVVDSVAALAEHPVPLIVVDMGTATTVCVINNKKNYIGGLILPGVRTASDSLVSNAAQLSQISLEKPKRLIGTNTIDCMKSGAMYGNAAALDGIIERINDELGEACTVVATGGLAKVIIPLCRHEIILDDNLLLKGLQIIYDKNR
ncbi:MAG: type III pantothenate kinase [Lachnospiraceae bacterium]|nr:type III pantothenate kinase [Lachnospiraceae bacterium]